MRERCALRRIGSRFSFFFFFFFLVAFAVSAGAGAGRAHAATAEQVEDLIRQGLDLRHAGQDSRALPFFRKAYESERTPRTAGQLGLCEMALGYWVDAEAHLGEALASTGHPWVEKNRSALASALRTTRDNIGTVSVMGGPAGAKVYLDTREVGALPLDRPLRLSRGPHDIEVRAPGPVTRTKTMVVQGGDDQTVTLVLEAAPIQTGAAAGTPPPTGAAGGVTGPVVIIEHPHGDSRGGSGRRTGAWIAGGAAVAAVAVGVAGTVLWVDNLNKFDDHVGPTGTKNCGASDPSYGGPGCQSLHDSLSTGRTLALIGYGVAAAAATTSIILFATSGPSEPKTTALACAPDLLERGMSCRIAF
jgi:hypothetical protein